VLVFAIMRPSGRLGPGAALIGLAIGALAVGAIAIGALAIGRLAIGRARIGHLEIDELTVRKIAGANRSAISPRDAEMSIEREREREL
jgi:hypothetical protein